MKSIWIIVAVVAIVSIAWFGFNSLKEVEVNPEARAVAEWLKTSGVKFYGAYWCPACETQKEFFGDAVSLLPYIESSMPNRSGQTKVAKDAGIKAYPTWEFIDGSRYEGVLSIEQLKERSDYPEPIIGAQLDE